MSLKAYGITNIALTTCGLLDPLSSGYVQIASKRQFLVFKVPLPVSTSHFFFAFIQLLNGTKRIITHLNTFFERYAGWTLARSHYTFRIRIKHTAQLEHSKLIYKFNRARLCLGLRLQQLNIMTNNRAR